MLGINIPVLSCFVSTIISGWVWTYKLHQAVNCCHTVDSYWWRDKHWRKESVMILWRNLDSFSRASCLLLTFNTVELSQKIQSSEVWMTMSYMQWPCITAHHLRQSLYPSDYNIQWHLFLFFPPKLDKYLPWRLTVRDWHHFEKY